MGTDTASMLNADDSKARQRICVLGATGTIGRATVATLARRGHDVVCLVRPHLGRDQLLASPESMNLPRGVAVKIVDFADGSALALCLSDDEKFDTVISCMASRTGAPDDAWAIDYSAHIAALQAAAQADVGHFVLLSAICVQKPLLAFQHAKLAFEAALIASGMRYSIVRPTAFFKSLSGQIERVRKGRPFLIFGDGTLTACKPISDSDLANYIADCLIDESRWNQILPIGGPGDAISPRQQGEALFEMLGQAPKFRSVPVAMLDGIIRLLSAIGAIVPAASKKAQLARIGRYYATESMLVLDPLTSQYDAASTPSTGTETLFDYYRSVIAGDAAPERGDHAVF